MILLFLLPFYDRSPERRPERRPIAMAAAFFTIAAMAFLTYEGANAGSPNQIDMEAPEAVVAAGPDNLRQWESGKQVVAQSGCLACHKIGHNGGTLGPDLSEIGERLARQAIARTLVNPTAPMPAYTDLSPEEARRPRRVPRAAEVRLPLAAACHRRPTRGRCRSRRCGRCSTASPASTTS